VALKIAIFKNHPVSLYKKVQGFQKYKFNSEKLKNNGDIMEELYIENPVRVVR
jgi:hypothetical protein